MVRPGPDETAPLYERVLHVINDVDPERLLAIGGPRDEYRDEAEEFTERLSRGEELTPDLVAQVWRHWFTDAAWLLQPANRYVLNKFARRLAALATRD